ncbi:MAG: phosphoribosylaminoimidazolesuccinocarboxamide synthase [Candidatus Omnitrophica bacterium CG07_land_8_20_14_0_80_50_8]|nr:MAG: phosphoribosylaminoimidazolesuccinocarboxamide synthase [Candidatus Omnitrophica bacterium CG07_land_8_20_14_0_80_50_8]
MTERETVWETRLPLPLLNRGKVRDIYGVGDDRLLIVTTDRLSAFDAVLPTPIIDKGRVLNQISLFWFEKFKALAKNHLITATVEKMGLDAPLVTEFGASLAGRSLLVHRARPLPVECVVRGFIAGSGWKDYQKTGRICGYALPKGMEQCSELPQPIFTPATKAAVGHDMNIDLHETIKLVGEKIAHQIRDLSIEIYKRGVEFAKTRGLLIADTKFEFGIYKDELILIDEVLTPDSSRFWPKDTYKPGQDQPSLDKQIVRNWLLKSGWNQTPPAPSLPSAIAVQTSRAYRDVFKKLTGKELT